MLALMLPCGCVAACVDKAPLCGDAQATSIKKLTSSQAPLNGSSAHCAAPAEANGDDSPAAVAAAKCIDDNDVCKAPAEVSAHLITCTLSPDKSR